MHAREINHGPVVTFEAMLAWKETDTGMVFTPDEQSLARSVAAAHFYCHTLCEDLPERAGLTSLAGIAWTFGLHQVVEHRAGWIRECYCGEKGETR